MIEDIVIRLTHKQQFPWRQHSSWHSIQILFFSCLGNEEPITVYELNFLLKDYCFAREDRIIGMALLQLKDIVVNVRKVSSHSHFC